MAKGRDTRFDPRRRPTQLPMFMLPDEVHEMVDRRYFNVTEGEPGARASASQVKHLRTEMRNESSALDSGIDDHRSLADSVDAVGVVQPLELGLFDGEPSLMDGHHRLFVSERHRNRYIPVIFHDENNMG